MADIGAQYTDQKEREIQKRIEDIYRQAAKDIEAKTEDFWRRHEIKDKIYRERVEKGKMEQEDYDAWKRGQVFQGKQWAAKLKQITDTMVRADQIAQDIINGAKKDIFTANANYVGYKLEHDAKIDLGFGLYDSSTVARLIRRKPNLLPAIAQEKIKPDVDAQWYQKMVANSITQGIIQGEGIEQIANRITSTCADRGMTAALRDARTAYTGAQNAGRIEGMHQAEALGIQLKKRWIATFDDKTRETHRELDGQEQNIDDPFVVDGDEIMYPGDPHAAPALVYNCRCTLGWSYPKYPASVNRRDNETGEDVGAMTYREWEAMKQGDDAVPGGFFVGV